MNFNLLKAIVYNRIALYHLGLRSYHFRKYAKHSIKGLKYVQKASDSLKLSDKG